jgi:hypothetical protein
MGKFEFGRAVRRVKCRENFAAQEQGGKPLREDDEGFRNRGCEKKTLETQISIESVNG